MSGISAGFIYYETPAINDIVPAAEKGTKSEFTPVVHLSGTPNADGTPNTFACLNDANCDISYSISHTPQVLSVYPSTVYSGQDICFEVFTDDTKDGGSVLTNLKIGDYSADIDTYQEDNLAKESKYYGYYHQCALAGGNKAASSSNINLLSSTGKYHVSDFAKSFDGISSYTVRSIPKITAISHQSLNTATGSIISITGEGFSSIASENSVDVGGNT